MLLTLLALFLIAVLVAAFNTAVGPTGGALIGTISYLVPPPASNLLHSINGTYASFSRARKLRQHLNIKFLTYFSLGAAAGILIASLLAVKIPHYLWSAIIGLYLIISTNFPKFEQLLANKNRIISISFMSSFVSFYTGTGGKIINPVILAIESEKYARVANQSACVVIQHIGKILGYAFLLTSLFNYLPHLSALILGSALGNNIGHRWLTGLPNTTHNLLQRSILTIMGFGLVAVSLHHFLFER